MKKSKFVLTALTSTLLLMSWGCQNNQSTNSKSAKSQVNSSVSSNSKKAAQEKKNQKLLAEKQNYIYSGKLSDSDKKKLANLDVSAFGDSIMEGCKPDYLKLFPKMQIDSGVSRQASSLASELQGKNLPNTIIIGLGTNGPFGEEYYNQIMKTLGNRQVYWINLNINRDWKDDVNAMLENGTHRYSNAHVINWAKYSQGHDDWFWDGIHPNIQGRQMMVDFVARNIIANEKFK